MGVKGLNHYLCQSTVASREIVLEEFAKEYKKQHNRQPLLVFDGESFWHVLHGSLPRIFGGQFIQFRKKAEDVCKRLTSMGFKLSFVFGNSPISADAKAEERGKQTLLHLTSFYRQILKKKNTPQINEIWPPCLRNVFPYYLRSLPNITVLQSLMDKDLSIACYAKDNNAAAIVSNDSDMILFAVCPVMHARGLVTARRRVVLMYPSHFCEDIGLSVERLPLLSVYLGNQETPITTNVVEASDGVIQRKIKSGDRGNVQDVIEYIRTLEAPINIEEVTRDIFQEVDDENINAVRVSLGRYILRERDYEFDVPPMYRKIKNSPMIEPIISPGDSMTPEISLFLEKIKKSVIKCDIILKAKAWRREFNVMHMAWPIPGVGIDNPEALYCPIFSAHAYLLGKKRHLMIVPRFEDDPIKLAEPAFQKIYLDTTPLQLPDGSPMPVAHELWISQDKRLQVTVLVAIWEASDLDFGTLMDLPPSSLCFILVLHWLRRKADMKDWEVFSFLATHVRMRHFSVDQLWRMDDMSISKSLTARSVVLGNVFSKLIGRFLWLVSLCGAPFKTMDLLPDLMFDGMVFQKKYEKARQKKHENEKKEDELDMNELIDSICSLLVIDSPKDRERVNKLFAILNGAKVPIFKHDNEDRCRPTPALSNSLDHEPIWYTEWSSNTSIRASQMHSRSRRGHVSNSRTRAQRPHYRTMSAMKSRRGGLGGFANKSMRGCATHKTHSDRDNRYSSSSSYKGGSECGYPTGPTLSNNKTQKTSVDHFSNDHNQSTDDTGYNTFASANPVQSQLIKSKQTNQAKGNEVDVLSFSDALSISKSNENTTKLSVGNMGHQVKHPATTSLQFGNISNYVDSDHDSDDGWSDPPQIRMSEKNSIGSNRPHGILEQQKPPNYPMARSKSGYKQASRDSWVDVWEDLPPVPTHNGHNMTSSIGQRLESRDTKDVHSDSAWEDIDTEKKTERYPGEWRNEKRGGINREDWIEKEKARGEISYAQAAGAVKQEKPAYHQSSLSGSEWAQQMIQNKNFQEFVPSSRPISRTPSESTQSEIDDAQQQYRTGLFMRDPRAHQAQRRHLMGYPHAYAAAGMRAYSIQKEMKIRGGTDSTEATGDMNMQQSYQPAIPLVMIPAMIPAPYLTPQMTNNQNL